MRHYDCLWFIYRLISPFSPTNEPVAMTNEPGESSFEPEWVTSEPGCCEGTRGGRMTQGALY